MGSQILSLVTGRTTNSVIRAATLAALFILFTSPQLLAQALSGTRTVGPTGNYPTLTAAIADVRAKTLGGPLVIELQAAYSSAAETFPLVFSNLTATATNTLTVRPESGAANLTIASSAAQTLDFDGASFVRLDGRAGGTGATSALTISNISPTGVALRFVNDATGNSISFAALRGINTSATGGVVVFGGSGGANGNDGNTIDSCSVAPAAGGTPANGFYSSGTAGAANSENTISNCTIADFYSATVSTSGIFLDAGNSAWTISGNRLYQTAPRTFTVANSHTGIRILSGDGHFIAANTIGFAAPAGTGTWTVNGAVATRFTGIEVSGEAPSPIVVDGNVIGGFNFTTTSGANTGSGVWCGISALAGNVQVGTVAGNLVGASSGVDSVIVSSGTNALVAGIHVATADTASVQRNSIGAITHTGSTSVLNSSLTGIQFAGTGAVTASLNNIGNATVDNLRAGATGTTIGSTNVSGIHIAALPASCSLTGNTIRNLSSFGAGASGFVRGIWTVASTSSASQFDIASNTIRDFKTASTLPTLANGHAAAVGINLAAGTNPTIRANTIFNIGRTNAATAGGTVAGITSANATSTSISGNRIYSLSNASTSAAATAPGVAVGVLIRSGTATATVINNMISLGTGQTTDTAFIGIMANHGSTPIPADSIFHNTIHIDGTATAGLQPSFGFSRGDFSGNTRTVAVDFRNNLITNVRTGGSVGHFAIGNNFGATASATGWSAGASDFNVLNSNAGTVGHWGGNRTFAAWRTASAGDASSFSGITVNYVNAANDLHLAMGTTPTQLESGGSVTSAGATDFDGDARPGPAGSVNGAAYLPDIGADEFDGVYLDAIAPAISFAPLRGASIDGATLEDVRITDITGTSTSGAFAPRIYFRKSGGAWFSRQGVLKSGTGRDGRWEFPIPATDLGGLAPGEVIFYYVVVQDSASTPNIASVPAGVSASDVNTIITPPTPPLNVRTFGNLNGTYSVGVGGVFSTITEALDAYNAGVSAGPIVFELTDATYPAETFPIVIEDSSAATPANTLTIKPSAGVTPTISGSSPDAILHLNGARYVTIEGSNGTAGLRALTFTNANTTAGAAVVLLNSTGGTGVLDCAIQNCNIAGGGATGFGIRSVGRDNDGIRFIANDLRDCRTAILSVGESTANRNSGLRIEQNVIGGMSAAGIVADFTDDIKVLANRIGGISSAVGSDVSAISLGFGSTPSFTATGTGTADGVTNVTVGGNTIGTVTQSNGLSATGIALGRADSGTSIISNNMISGVASNAAGSRIAAAILLGGGDAPTKVYHNTASMQGAISGAPTATQISAALAITNAAVPPALDLRNNIFVNTQTGNTGATLRLCSIFLNAPPPYAGVISDRNVLFSEGSGPGEYAIGVTATSSRTSFADWQAATGIDATSINVAPPFVSASDPHLASESSPLVGNGIALAEVTTDIDGNARNLPPDPGADEFFPSANANLTGLVPSAGTLSPAFDSAVANYNFRVPNSTATITFTPSTFRPNSTIEVNGAAVVSGHASNQVPLAVGDNTVTVKVTAQNGVATRTYTVVVRRNTPPTVRVPFVPVVVEATSPAGTAVTFSVTAADPEDGALVPTVTPPSGSVFAIGEHTVNASATDSDGTTTNGSFLVRVRDTIAPQIGGDFSPVLVAAGLLADYRTQVIASDLVGVTEVTQTPAPGTAISQGTVPVTMTARDAAGNSRDVTFDVLVRPAAPVTTKAIGSGEPAPGAGTNSLPSDAVLTSFFTPSIDDTGALAFLANWKSGSGQKGIGLFTGSKCLGIVGGPSPFTGSRYVRFTEPPADGGMTASIVAIAGAPGTPGAAVVRNLTPGGPLVIAALSGTTGTPDGAKFKAFKNVDISGRHTAILAQLASGTGTVKPVSAANDMGIWIKDGAGPLIPALREGQTLPSGRVISSLTAFLPSVSSPGQGRGWIVPNAAGGVRVMALVQFTDRTQAVLAIDSSNVANPTVIAITAQPGNGGPDIAGATFATIGLPALAADQSSAFLAQLTIGQGGITKTDNKGIFTRAAASGPHTAIARIGGPAISGTVFSTLGDPVVGNDGGLAFSATLKGGSAKGTAAKTLWWQPPGGTATLLAQGGTRPASDLPADTQWKSFTSLSIAGGGRGPIFIGALVPKKGGVTPANANGVWAIDFTGTLRTIFRTGDVVSGKTVKSFSLLKAGTGTAGVTRSFNDTAHVVWIATFTDRTTAIVTTEIP